MIIKPTDAPQMIFSLAKKAFSYQEGALAFVAAPTGYGVKELFFIIFENIPAKELLMPIVLFAFCLFAFVVVSIYDFYTGISASKKEHIISTGSARGYIKSDKLWSSIWKLQGVIMIASLIVLFNYIFIAIGFSMIASTCLAAIPIFFLVVILFDVRSIGENHFRRYGSKPKFYVFMDDVAKAIREGVIQKIKNLFNL